MFSFTAVFFPYNRTQSPSFEIETGRFYKSDTTILFANNIQNSILSGVIVGINSTSRENAEAYSGRYSVSESMVLKLAGNTDGYIVEAPNPYDKFFDFFIKISSFMAENIGNSGKPDLKALFLKSFAIVFTISTISFFFSTGKWHLINYILSQSLVICFIGFNIYIRRFTLPQFLYGAESLIPFDSGLYYFAYIVISFCILLAKILSLRTRK